MNNKIKIATSIAIKLREHLEYHHRSIADKYKLMLNQFPKNSCEPTSIFLGSLLSEKFGSDNVFIIKINCKKIGGLHFFVEFENSYYDLTFDQFDFGKNMIIAGDAPPFDGVSHDVCFRQSFNDFILLYCDDRYNNKELIQLALKEINSVIVYSCTNEIFTPKI